jgi:hypothetical protein
MAISFADLIEKPFVLPPVEVDITGLPEALLVHQFTMNQMAELMEHEEGAEPELVLRNQVLQFLNGFDYSPTEEARSQLGDMFASWQLRELYNKAIRLNGFGPEALRDAQKN